MSAKEKKKPHYAKHTKPPVTSRGIRVFVSSTFLDMQEEREELIKRIFPQLKKLCEERGVSWSEVDLRWGITDEQKAEGKVLPICLAEIKNCRPYFIGLLGERYGWVPDDIPAELVEQEPWLAEHRESSVTELEIIHGVLAHPGMAKHAFFYFRSPAFIDRMPPEKRTHFVEQPSPLEIERYGKEEAGRRAQWRRKKLAELKTRIEAAGFVVRKDYPTPQKLGELVLQDMTGVVNRLYPAKTIPNAWDAEINAHELFAAGLTRITIERAEYTARLDRFVKQKERPLVLVGDVGAGKSTLLARWAAHHKKKYFTDLFIMHFVGATSRSTEWTGTMQRIMRDLKIRFGFQQEIPEETNYLAALFQEWLKIAAEKGDIILIIDSVDRLQYREMESRLSWLPAEMPGTVHLILSAQSGDVVTECQNRGWQILFLSPFSAEERRQLTIAYLAQYRKTLGSDQLTRIVKAPQTCHPLFLVMLLEELRIFGDNLKLNAALENLLAAGTISDLYEMMLDRFEKDFESERPGLVKDFMAALWAARQGLSETEMLEILGEQGHRLPQAYWSPLFLAAQRSLVNRSGLHQFSHDNFRQIVQQRYVMSMGEKAKAHTVLADYFDSQPVYQRKVEELPWQLMKAQKTRRLYSALTDLSFFAHIWALDPYDAKTYWAFVEANSAFNAIGAYRPVIAAPEKHSHFITLVGNILTATGHLDESYSYHQKLVTLGEKTGDRLLERYARVQLAGISRMRGDLNSMVKYHDQLSMLDREKDIFSKQSLTCRQMEYILHEKMFGERIDPVEAQIKLLADKGDRAGVRDAADRYSREVAQWDSILEKIQHRERTSDDELLKLNAQLEGLYQKSGSKKEQVTIALLQAVTCADIGRPDEALKYALGAVTTGRECDMKEELLQALKCYGGLLVVKGKRQEAASVFSEAEKICREMGDKYNLAGVLIFHADLLGRSIRNRKPALVKFREAITLLSGMNIPIELARARYLYFYTVIGATSWRRPAMLIFFLLVCVGLSFWRPQLAVFLSPVFLIGVLVVGMKIFQYFKRSNDRFGNTPHSGLMQSLVDIHFQNNVKFKNENS